MKKLGRNDLCWCGSGKKYKKCHMAQDESEGIIRPAAAAPAGESFGDNRISLRTVPLHIERPEYAATGRGEHNCEGFSRLAGRELNDMRAACRGARRVLDRALAVVSPGVTTDEIDAVVHDACIAEGGYPSPLNYHGFPKSVCTSVNEVICHGIPGGRFLKEGDIVNIDVTLFLNGKHGDCSETVPVGNIDPESHHLLTTARESLKIGIDAIRPDGCIGDIGCAIEQYVSGSGCSIVRAYCGHGVGRCFHMEPAVLHYCSRDRSAKIKPGMVFTVEPMINLGVWEHKVWSDGWTAVTADGRRSAQFEHTILVTDTGVEILTGNG